MDVPPSKPSARADDGDGDRAGGAADSSRLLKEANEKLLLATLRTQDLLEASEAFRLLVESVEDYAIFMLDPSGRVAKWNASAERVYGYASREIVGRHFSVFYSGEGGVAWDQSTRDLATAQGAGRSESEGPSVRKDGTRFWASRVLALLRDEAGRPSGFAIAARDLSERVRAEQQRMQLSRIEEAERRRDEFLAIMGHELRNPLAPMVTAIHLMKLRGGRKSEKEIAVLERQLQHMMRLVDDLLDVSRVLGDRLKLARHVTDIGDVLADAVEMASPLIEKKRQRLAIEVPVRSLFVDVDRERMAQVFGNLLNNAAKYTGDGGDIRVHAVADSGAVQVTIVDTGIGMLPDLLPRVFELFTQGKQGIERQLGGLGVGLAVARRLVEEHGGAISAASDGPDRGSCFTVRLPEAEEAQVAPSLPPPRTSASGPPKRILVVDDNIDSSEMMCALLGEFGHDIRVATDGPSALRVANEFHPDLVFLDIGLPGLSGFEVARRMREIPESATIPIFAVTGYAREADRAQALESGFSDLLAKPVDPERIRKLAESLDATE